MGVPETRYETELRAAKRIEDPSIRRRMIARINDAFGPRPDASNGRGDPDLASLSPYCGAYGQDGQDHLLMPIRDSRPDDLGRIVMECEGCGGQIRQHPR